MRARAETLTDIPLEMVDEIVASFASEGARVEKRRQPDGRWTVVAVFEPEEPSKLKRAFKR